MVFQYDWKENLAQARWRVCTSKAQLQNKHASCTWVFCDLQCGNKTYDAESQQMLQNVTCNSNTKLSWTQCVMQKVPMQNHVCVLLQCQTGAGMARCIESNSVERFKAKVVINHQGVCRPRLCDSWSSRRHCKTRMQVARWFCNMQCGKSSPSSSGMEKQWSYSCCQYKLEENLAQARWRVRTSKAQLQNSHANCTWVFCYMRCGIKTCDADK